MVGGKSFLAGALLSITAMYPALASIPPTHSIAVRHFGRVTVGDQIDGLPWIARERAEIHSLHHRAHFFAYIYRADLPGRCVNLQCGTIARQVLSHGGFLIGGADEELSHEIGWDSEANPPESLLVISDRSGRVTGIYKSVSASNLHDILEHLPD